jgi:hypothetical protein
MAKLLRNPFEKPPRDLPSGLKFERHVMSYLGEHLSNQYIIIPNVIMDNSPDASHTSGAITRREIDHLIIGPNGLFFTRSEELPGAHRRLSVGLLGHN